MTIIYEAPTAYLENKYKHMSLVETSLQQKKNIAFEKNIDPVPY